ncbi:MAG: hypothetical protein IIX35_03360 [Paraprevotella sp.]|nr:hypothetical protein [Paraprevotella sp.]
MDKGYFTKAQWHRASPLCGDEMIRRVLSSPVNRKHPGHLEEVHRNNITYI